MYFYRNECLTQAKKKQLFQRGGGELGGVAFAVLIIEAMLTLDFDERQWVWLQCGVPIDPRNHAILRLGAFLKKFSELKRTGGTPMNFGEDGTEALKLRLMIFGAQNSFDGCSMGIGKGVAVIRGEKMMRNALISKALS